MKKHENFIYFPSFSVGNFSTCMRDDKKMRGGLPMRFYSDEFPAEYRHPYFLVTAGHFYKKKTFKSDWGFDLYDDMLLLGDSGGFQIASGAIKWDPKIRHEIFEWLENNSNIAMNLDIPPRLKYEGKVRECLEISKENFKYFADKQTGRTDFLNVLQGDNEASFAKWYQEVKDFEFKGWGIGGAGGSLFRFMTAIMTLMENKEQYKTTNKWIHILGTSKIIHFLILSQLQKSLSDIGSTMRVTTDSSTPSRGLVYGDLYTYGDFKNSKWRFVHLPKERAENNQSMTKYADNKLSSHEFLLPETGQFDYLLRDQYTYQDILEWNDNATAAAIMHNFMLFKQVADECHNHVYTHPYLLEQLINSDQYLVLKAVDEMVKAYENGTTPALVFAQYKPHFMKMTSSKAIKTSNSVITHNFF